MQFQQKLKLMAVRVLKQGSPFRRGSNTKGWGEGRPCLYQHISHSLDAGQSREEGNYDSEKAAPFSQNQFPRITCEKNECFHPKRVTYRYTTTYKYYRGIFM